MDMQHVSGVLLICVQLMADMHPSHKYISVRMYGAKLPMEMVQATTVAHLSQPL